jgi:hypothetical protein
MNTTEREQFEAVMSASMSKAHQQRYAEMIAAQRAMRNLPVAADEAVTAHLDAVFNAKREHFLRSLINDDRQAANTLLSVWSTDSRAILETLTFDDDDSSIEHNLLAVLAVEYCHAARVAVAEFSKDLNEARERWLNGVRENARQFAQRQCRAPASAVFLDPTVETMIRNWKALPDSDDSF